MKLYRICKWNELYENNRSRTVKDLAWVAIPNRHDGENYSLIVSHPDGSEIFSGFILMVQVASKCTPRGTLIRDNGKPHTVSSLSLKCRAPVSWFEKALAYLETNTDWIESEEVATERQETVSVLPSSCQAGDEEGRGGKEEKGGKEAHYPEPAFPSWEQWWAYCQRIGLGAEWKARDEWHRQESKQWAGIQKWQAHASRVRTWWESDGRPMAPKSNTPKRNKGPNI